MSIDRPTYRLPAATLVEVLVAMALAGLVFGIAAATWVQLNGQQAAWNLLDHRLTARDMLWQASQENVPPTSTIREEGGVYFVRDYTPLNPQTDLYQVEVRCLNAQDQLIFKRSKIIRLHES